MSPQKLTETFKSMSDGLYRVAFYILESQPDAQDVVQDLFIKLWNTRDELDKVLNLKAYCTTLIKNLCIDRIRKASKEQIIEPQTDISESRTIDDDLIAKDKLGRVMAAIERLCGLASSILRSSRCFISNLNKYFRTSLAEVPRHCTLLIR